MRGSRFAVHRSRFTVHSCRQSPPGKHWFTATGVLGDRCSSP